MDRSGLARQTGSFCDSWDSGQAGWICVSKNDTLKEFDAEKIKIMRI
ncbi:MAG: hypothetical protein NC341_10890 [Blautia sp.]|nr:hypothetical protein [Blautia sp.]